MKYKWLRAAVGKAMCFWVLLSYRIWSRGTVREKPARECMRHDSNGATASIHWDTSDLEVHSEHLLRLSDVK
jgi:hypothetical protein